MSYCLTVMVHEKTLTPLKTLKYVVFSAVWCYGSCVTFNEVTDIVFPNVNCVVSAFGDFNSDKLTDVFCILNGGNTLDVLLTHDRKQLPLQNKISCSVGEKEVITSVMAADFNGDSMMDVLITVREKDSKTDVRILWGNLDKLNCTSPTNFSSKSQPLLMDYNGDMVPDIFAESEEGLRYFWTIDKLSKAPKKGPSPLKSIQTLSVPHSCAFVDLNNDMEPDLFVTGKDSMEVWYHYQDGLFNFSGNVTNYPENFRFHGQSIFVDINGDGILEHVMPACKDDKCTKCAVLVRSLQDSVWKLFFQDFSFLNETWCFLHFSKLFEFIELPVALRSADFDMDGMPDFLTVVANEGGTASLALLLKNVPCSSCPLGRTLLPLWNILSSAKNVVLASFYELFEDGIIDILLNTRVGSEYKLHAFQNMLTTDAYFIKVLVLGGLCYDACPGNHMAYGTNQPGPSISYNTTGPDGTPRTGIMPQLPQSAHFALQLPYSIFGLGQTPNFVDQLQVVVPGGGAKDKLVRTWTQIIPNSQIVVIPYPPDNPKMWLAKLFVTPSHSILITFLALVGTCLFICLIILALHWKERRADRRERLLEAHRFHFDAM